MLCIQIFRARQDFLSDTLRWIVLTDQATVFQNLVPKKGCCLTEYHQMYISKQFVGHIQLYLGAFEA